MQHFAFFQNRECEYFPCHGNIDPEKLNCLFCYCPLYALGDRCGGAFRYTPGGIKDCSGCIFPHRPENYDAVQEKLRQVMEMAKKPEHNRENP